MVVAAACVVICYTVKESQSRLLMINIMDKIKADKGNEEYIGRWGTTYKGLLQETLLKKVTSQVKGKSHVNIWE